MPPMTPDEKIFKTLERIKHKIELSPSSVAIDYRAGWEDNGLDSEEEIMILNKLAEEGVIEVLDNFASDYV